MVQQIWTYLLLLEQVVRITLNLLMMDNNDIITIQMYQFKLTNKGISTVHFSLSIPFYLAVRCQ